MFKTSDSGEAATVLPATAVCTSLPPSSCSVWPHVSTDPSLSACSASPSCYHSGSTRNITTSRTS
jgi:hypothetical protein